MHQTAVCHVVSVGSTTLSFTFVDDTLSWVELAYPLRTNADDIRDAEYEITERLPEGAQLVPLPHGWRGRMHRRAWEVSYV